MSAAVPGIEPRHEWHTLASGVELHAVHWEPVSTSPDDPVPFLLVHGLASNARLWDGVAEHLSRTRAPGGGDRPARSRTLVETR